MSNWPNRDSPRQHWTEEHLCIDGYTYTFDSYGKKSVKRISYRCIHGSRNTHTHTHTELHEMMAAPLISFSLCTLVFSIPYILFQPLGNDI